MYMLQEVTGTAEHLWQETTKAAETMWQEVTKAVGLSTHSDESARHSADLARPPKPKTSWATLSTDLIRHTAGFLPVDDVCRLQHVEQRLRHIILDHLVPIHFQSSSFPLALTNNLLKNDAQNVRLRAIAAKVKVLTLNFYCFPEANRVQVIQFFPKAQEITFSGAGNISEPSLAHLPDSVQTVIFTTDILIHGPHRTLLFLQASRVKQAYFRLGDYATRHLIIPFLRPFPNPIKVQATKTLAGRALSVNFRSLSSQEFDKALELLPLFENLQEIALSLEQKKAILRKLMNEAAGTRTFEILAKQFTSIGARELEQISEDDFEKLLPNLSHLEKLDLPSHFTGSCFKALPHSLKEVSSHGTDGRIDGRITDINLTYLKQLPSLISLHIESSEILATTLHELPLSLRKITIYSSKLWLSFGNTQSQALLARGTTYVDIRALALYDTILKIYDTLLKIIELVSDFFKNYSPVILRVGVAVCKVAITILRVAAIMFAITVVASAIFDAMRT